MAAQFRFNFTRHKYAGGGHPGCGGYLELLEVSDPPDGHCGVVLYLFISDRSPGCGSMFWEFDSAADVLARWDHLQRSVRDHIAATARQTPGFRREVNCGRRTPWFYANGTQALSGDLALQE